MKKIKKIALIFLSVLILFTVIWVVRFLYVHEENKDGLPILGYHAVVEDDIKEKYYEWDVYVMSKTQFEEQMKYLYEEGYETLSMREVEAYYNGTRSLKKKSVAITFDDGYLNTKMIAQPILEKYKLKGTCFIIGSKINKPTKRKGLSYLKRIDLKSDKTMAYFSHSYNLHRTAKGFDKKKMDNASYDEITNDFKKNQELVEDHYFAFPYGRSSDIAQTYLRESDVRLALGYNQNRNMTQKDNQFLLPRYLVFSKMPMFYFKWIVE